MDDRRDLRSAPLRGRPSRAARGHWLLSPRSGASRDGGVRGSSCGRGPRPAARPGGDRCERHRGTRPRPRGVAGRRAEAGIRSSAGPERTSTARGVGTDVVPCCSRRPRAPGRHVRVAISRPGLGVDRDRGGGGPRPFVYITFGTETGRMPIFETVYRAAVRAVEVLDVDVLITVGTGCRPGRAGRTTPARPGRALGRPVNGPRPSSCGRLSRRRWLGRRCTRRRGSARGRSPLRGRPAHQRSVCRCCRRRPGGERGC